MTRLFSVLILLLLIITGCSSNQQTPVTPQDAGSDFPVGISADNKPVEGSRCLLGVWELEFDVESLEAIVTPSRLANTHYQVKYLIPTPEVVINAFHPNYVVDADVTLTNPFTFDAYDIRLILFTDDEPHILENPDCWTGLYDIPVGLPINPFKAYAKDEPNRVFAGGTNHTENLLVFSPPGSHPIQFAVDASYPSNCEEPYAFENFTQGVLHESIGSQAAVTVDVHDWQDDVNEVYLECPEITNEPQSQLEHVALSRWKLNLVNNTGVLCGEYSAYLVAKSSNSGSLALYNRILINVTSGSGAPDTDPPVWYWNVGIEQARAGYEYVKIEWGTATDTESPPVEYLLYMDEDDNPWDQPPVVAINCEPYTFTGLENGRTYWFGVRCRDSASPPNEDTNTNVLSVEPGDVPGDPRIVGTIKKCIRNTCDIAFSENYSYYTMGSACEISNGFGILDISNPERPEFISSVALPPYDVPIHYQIIPDGEIVYLAGSSSSDTYCFTVMDVSDIFNPHVITSFEGAAKIYHLSLATNTICIYGKFNGDFGYMLIDVSNPGNPEIKSITQTPERRDVYASGSYAYYSVEKQIFVIDISDPQNPEEAAIYDYDYILGDVIGFVPGYLFTCGHTSREAFFYTIDISDPLNPAVADSMWIVNMTMHDVVQVLDVSFTSERLYVLYTEASRCYVRIYNITDPANVGFEIGNNHHWEFDIAAYNNYLFGTSPDGLRITDCNDPDNIDFVRIFSGFNPHSIVTKGTYAYCGIKDHDQIAVIDISNPSAPYIVSEMYLGDNYPHSAYDVAINDDILYVADGASGLKVVDISNPGFPELISSLEMTEDATSIDVSGDYAYIVMEYYGLGIVNISNPQAPTLDNFYEEYDIRDVDIQGNYAYITMYNPHYDPMLEILDISDPLNFNVTGSIFNTQYACYMITVNNNIAIIGGYNEACVVDITNPYEPEIASSLQIRSDLDACAISGIYAYLGSGDFHIYDISNPGSPELVSKTVIWYIEDIEIDNNHAYLAVGGTGIQVLELW